MDKKKPYESPVVRVVGSLQELTLLIAEARTTTHPTASSTTGRS